MFKSTINQSNESLGVNNPTAADEQTVKNELEKIKTLSDEEMSARKSFIQGLVARGQVADLGESILHRHTHLVIGSEPDGTPIVKRIKF